MAPPSINVLVGQIYDQLTVIKELERDPATWNPRRFLVKCTCGSEPFVINLKTLREHGTHKCRACSSVNNGTIKHGHSQTKIYYVWQSMLQRCENICNHAYEFYGGRGIIVCAEWHTFEKFLEDMQLSYQEGLSLDRIDNNKNYSKENCRWATTLQQNNNKRKRNQHSLPNTYYGE